MADDLRNAGAFYVDAPVVVDGNFITSPHYRNNGDFMKAVLAKYYE
jgi:protease I